MESVPEPVISFLRQLRGRIHSKDIQQLHNSYEYFFSKLSERYFSERRWPSAEAVAHVADWDEVFVLLYKQAYYRHVYARMTPSLSDSLDSFQNFINLFNMLLQQSMETPVLDLPNVWLWDMIDSFVTQFQHFRAHFLYPTAERSSEDAELLSKNAQAWSCQTVLRYLHALVAKGVINVKFNKSISDEDIDGVVVSNIARMTGLFALVGLLRVHTLTGDYKSALQVMSGVDLRKRSAVCSVFHCFVTVHYYMAVCYIMQRRYVDAVHKLTQVLLHYSASQRQQQHGSTLLHIEVKARMDKMLGLLTLTQCMCPGVESTYRSDDALSQTAQNKFSEYIHSMKKGDTDAFARLFRLVAPAYVSMSTPASFSVPATRPDVLARQVSVFLCDVEQRLPLRKLQTDQLTVFNAISLDKLTERLQQKSNKSKEVAGEAKEEIDSTAMCLSLKLLSYSKQCLSGMDAPVHGAFINDSNRDFYVANDVVHVTNTRPPRRFGDFFIRHIHRFQETTRDLTKAN